MGKRTGGLFQCNACGGAPGTSTRCAACNIYREKQRLEKAGEALEKLVAALESAEALVEGGLLWELGGEGLPRCVGCNRAEAVHLQRAILEARVAMAAANMPRSRGA